MKELELVQQCLKGDKKSWEQFIDRYSRLVYNYIYEILLLKSPHLVNQSNVNDLFQDIFLLLMKDNFEKLRSFKAKNGCSLASWLRQVVTNFTIDYMRKNRKMVSLDEENSSQHTLQEALADDAAPASEMVSQNEEMSHLTECIAQLDTEEKYFLEIHLHRQCSLDELKGIFGVSRGAVDMRKSRILQKLRECFKSKGFEI